MANTSVPAAQQHMSRPEEWFNKLLDLLKKLGEMSGLDAACRDCIDKLNAGVNSSETAQKLLTAFQRVHETIDENRPKWDDVSIEKARELYLDVIKAFSGYLKSGQEKATPSIQWLKEEVEKLSPVGKFDLSAAQEGLEKMKNIIKDLAEKNNLTLDDLNAYITVASEKIGQLREVPELVAVQAKPYYETYNVYYGKACDAMAKVGEELKKVQEKIPDNVSTNLLQTYTSVQQQIMQISIPTIQDMKSVIQNEEGEYDISQAMEKLNNIKDLAVESGHEKLQNVTEQTVEITKAFFEEVKNYGKISLEKGEQTTTNIKEKLQPVLARFAELGAEIRGYVAANPFAIKMYYLFAEAQGYIISSLRHLVSKLKELKDSGKLTQTLKDGAIDTAVKLNTAYPGFLPMLQKYYNASTTVACGLTDYRVVSGGVEVLKTLDEKVLSNRGQQTLEGAVSKVEEGKTYVQKEWNDGLERNKIN